MKYDLDSLSPLYQNPAGVSIRMIPRSVLRSDTIPSPLAGRNVIPLPSCDATLFLSPGGKATIVPSPLAGEGQGEGGAKQLLAHSS